jgi:hypothetical protein
MVYCRSMAAEMYHLYTERDGRLRASRTSLNELCLQDFSTLGEEPYRIEDDRGNIVSELELCDCALCDDTDEVDVGSNFNCPIHREDNDEEDVDVYLHIGDDCHIKL